MNKCIYTEYNGVVIQPEMGVFGSGCLIYDGKIIQETLLSPAAVRNKVLVDSENAIVSNETVVFIGVFYNCWGHSLTDSLRFLWIFLPKYKNLFDKLLQTSKLVFITAGGEEGRIIGKNFSDLLSILGVTKYQFQEVKEKTFFTKVIVPTPCFYEDPITIEKHFTDKYLEIIDFIMADINRNILPNPSKTVYFSRAHWQKGIKRKDFGEKSIEKSVRQCFSDCEIVYPEDLTFQEQVVLLSNTKKLITTEGSISHNAIFLQKGSELVLLQKCWLRNRYQKAINKAKELKIVYLKAYWRNHLFQKKLNPMSGPFFLCATSEIANYLKSKKTFSLSERVLYDYVCMVHSIRAIVVRCKKKS